jgi:hypothetical protein
MRHRPLTVLTILLALQPFLCLAQDKGTYQEEADRLAVLEASARQDC